MTTQYNVSDLTDGNIDGNGVFDVLMRSMSAHLQKELDAGRITGTNFADVYTSLASNTMTQSIQFLLAKDSAGAQADLVREQVATQVNSTALEAERVNTQTNQTLDVVAATTLKNAQEAMVEAETLNVPKQGILTDNQSADVLVATDLKTAQIANVEAETQVILERGGYR